MEKRVELLAPAGSIESFYAAVNSGADSVYLGGKFFNARYNSKNFEKDELTNIIRYAHNKNVKVYVTLNTVIKDTEIIDLLNYAIFLYENDVDAVIVQDLGVLYLLNKFLPDLNLNVSTQGVVYDEYGVKFFEHYKVKKVILARELAQESLKRVVDKSKTDIEVFVHGALCTCYSGQCYMSSFLGGRSGNRGKCAQPCRLSYSFIDKRKNKELEEYKNTPLLSLKDLNASKSIKKLIDIGIKAFKIEGRMKGPEYTSTVVEYYKKIIDSYYEGTEIDLSKEESDAVSTFSRGYTNSYINFDKDDDMYAKTSSGVKGENIDEIEEKVKLKTEEFSKYRRIKVNFELTLKIGEKAVLVAQDDKNKVTVYSEENCESSLKNPVTEEIIYEQLGKLGNTIYELSKIEAIIEDNAFIRKSTLNQLRRDATDILYEKGAVSYNRNKVDDILIADLFTKNNRKVNLKPKVSLKINSLEELYLVDKVKVSRVYIPYDLELENIKNIDVHEKYLYLPNIINKTNYEKIKNNLIMYEEIFDGVCINNVGSFEFFKENSNLKIHCGQFFNIINSFNVVALEERGANGFAFSIEANIKDMKSITDRANINSEIIAYQYVELMNMKNCPMSVLKNCKNLQDCEKCEYKDNMELKDRKGVNFNIVRENKTTKIYNSVPLTLLGKMDEFVKSNISYFLVDTKFIENAEEVIDTIYCEINGLNTTNILNENSYTRGHYFKNIL